MSDGEFGFGDCGGCVVCVLPARLFADVVKMLSCNFIISREYFHGILQGCSVFLFLYFHLSYFRATYMVLVYRHCSSFLCLPTYVLLQLDSRSICVM